MISDSFPVQDSRNISKQNAALLPDDEIVLSSSKQKSHLFSLQSHSNLQAEGFSLPETLKARLEKEVRPLRIEILDCSGREGHKKSAEAVQNAIKDNLAINGTKIEFSRKDIGTHMSPDPLTKMTFGKYTMIDFYNTLLRHGKTKMIRAMSKAGELVHPFYLNSNVDYFNCRYDSKAAKDKKPDLIISAVPMINGPLLSSLEGRNIPLLVVTTDGGSRLFSLNWPENQEHVLYKYCIPYNSLEIAKKIANAVKPSNVRGIGYPVRKEFLKAYSTDEKTGFRNELSVPLGKKVVGLMMGGNGGVALEDYFKEVLIGIKASTLKYNNLHVSFICGSNHALELNLIRKALNFGFKLKDENGEATILEHSSGVSFSIVGFTKNVHKYMALAGCFVTKAGSSSFNECLSMAVPMLLDKSLGCLPWEELNLELAETCHFGQPVKKMGYFISQLNSILEFKANKGYFDAMNEYRKDRPEQCIFGKKIVQLSCELLKEAEEERLKRRISKKEALVQATGDALDKIYKREGVFETLKSISVAIAEIAKKIYDVAIACLMLPITATIRGVKRLIKGTVDFFYFTGFVLGEETKTRRRKELICGFRKKEGGETIQSSHKAKPIEGSDSPLYSSVSKLPIDALYIKSGAKKRTGNTILYVLGKEYQAFHPRNYDHLLDDGADVVLFNPSQHTAKAMASDLKSIVSELKKRNPEQEILLHGYCIGAHVAVSVAIDFAEKANLMLPVVVDRGFGDGFKIAKRICSLAKIPYVKKYIKKYYNNSTEERINQHKGAMLFLSLKNCVYKFKDKTIKDYTKVLYKNHQQEHDKFIELENADHWTQWTFGIHNEVKKFLKDRGIIRKDYKEFNEQDSGGFLKETSVPWYRKPLIPLGCQ